jgi:ankyrin repeat protein
VLDAQNGDSDLQVEYIKYIKANFPGMDVIAGNVVRASQAKTLLDAGADIQTRNVNGNTSLHLVCSKNMTELLLQSGAKVSIENNEGKIPLETAMEHKAEPDFVEVADLSNEILSIADPAKIFLRTNKFNDVDAALYNGVFNFSSSLLKTDQFLNTIELITYLRGKLGFEVNVNLESLKETQKEMIDEFNW